MPSKDRDVDLDAADANDRPREKHRRSKSERKPDRNRDRERGERDRDREYRHRRTPKSSRSKLSATGEGGEPQSPSSGRKHRRKGRDDHDDDVKDRRASTSDIAPDASRTSLGSQRISMPYPSFSKAHSKEAIHSRDDLAGRESSNPLTPEPTDVGDDTRRSKSADLPRKASISKKSSRPPSPPETDVSADKQPRQKPSEEELQKRTDSPARPSSTSSAPHRPPSQVGRGSKVSDRSKSSSQATFVKAAPLKPHDNLRTSSRTSSLSRESIRRSASNRSLKKAEAAEAESSPSSVQGSSPRTPTQGTPFSPPVYDGPNIEVSSTPDLAPEEVDPSSKTATPASGFTGAPQPPPPPPPPPPMLDIQDIPRVDYLLHNGGLSYPVPRNFLSVLPRQTGGRFSSPPQDGADSLFAPFASLLEQYNTVIAKSGSIAVATGHRSVARRLLDRLENVFSRDLPATGCMCVMCEKAHEVHQGLLWGDVLEWVSGRIELPPWPPFDLAEIGNKAAEISAEEPRRPASPVKLDPDIAEEFREHYLRQSKKVRSSVDKWLSNTGETPAPPPVDVDDETLTFAILTNLSAEDRPYFNALLSGSRELKPANRAPTPLQRQRNDLIIKTGLSLQRLYRLQQVPRDAESACYLIKNPQTHDLLVTLSHINQSEWEILTSGRFDGFLWSGADGDDTTPTDSRAETPANVFRPGTTSPGPRPGSAFSSRLGTPASVYSRGATPASFVSIGSAKAGGSRQPVSNDEEMEMAAIAEIEREIYAGMESLEDAFEKLHLKAEVVRTALRQRGAGLMQSLQNRKRIDVLSAPPSGDSQNTGYERPSWAGGSQSDAGSDSEWGMDDVDIMPDDSASNISSSRHRRPKRRTQRRTPAPIEEEDER